MIPISAITLLIGAIIFVGMPRVGSGMFGQVPQPIASGALSGFARSIEFTSVAAIEESDRLVMRLVVTDEYGNTAKNGSALYLRGEVLDQYDCRFPAKNRGWGYRRNTAADENTRIYELTPADENGFSTSLVPENPPVPTGPMLIQSYRIEPTNDLTLFTCYPAIEISSPSLTAVRKWIDSQILQPTRPIRKTLEYTIKSPQSPAFAAELLARERGDIEVPAFPPPVLSPEAQQRVLDLIAGQTAGIGRLDDPCKPSGVRAQTRIVPPDRTVSRTP